MLAIVSAVLRLHTYILCIQVENLAAPHHKYNVLFLLVLGAAAQHFTRGAFAPSCLHFSAPFEVVQ